MGEEMSEGSKARDPWTAAIAAVLRAERAARGMTQREVYDAAGVSRSTYLRLEDGTRVADALQIIRICSVYRMPVSRFWHLVEGRFAEMAGE